MKLSKLQTCAGLEGRALELSHALYYLKILFQDRRQLRHVNRRWYVRSEIYRVRALIRRLKHGL